MNRIDSLPGHERKSRTPSVNIGRLGCPVHVAKSVLCETDRGLGLLNDFKQNLEAASGFEPLHRGFADLSLNHLGTPPLEDS